MLLWANGRTGNTEELELENAGLTGNGRGQIEVNVTTDARAAHLRGGRHRRPAGLASAAYVQGRTRRAHPRPDGRAAPAGDIPTGIYTSRRSARSAAPSASSGGQGALRGRPRRSTTWRARRSPARRSACSRCCSTARRWRCSASTASATGPRRSSTSARPSWPARTATHPLLHQHHVQLPHDGRGVSRGRLQRHQPTDLIRTRGESCE